MIREPADLTREPREQRPYYLGPDPAEQQAMLAALGLSTLGDLYAHLGADRWQEPLALPEALAYAEAVERLHKLAAKNQPRPSFIGDGLTDFSTHPIAAYVASLRGLTTAYTPYQPERSQGTLIAHWIYQSTLSLLTGFEAINSSLYERASATYEAITTALRLAKDAQRVLLAETLLPMDLEVIRTLAADAGVELESFPADPQRGTLDLAALERLLSGDRVAVVVFPQVNHLGLLEDVNRLTDLTHAAGARALAVVDPCLLAEGALRRPAQFGALGADLLAGEAQPLAIGPNFGGPGLGLFGVRQDAAHANDIRQSPGRYVGQAQDTADRPCFTMVLSTREQHIRKEKATSNICSNQAFVATLAGAVLLARGDAGLKAQADRARAQVLAALEGLLQVPGVRLAYPQTPFWNEAVIELPEPVAAFLEAARRAGLHAGVDVSDRVPGGRHLLKISCGDKDLPVQDLVACVRSRRYTGPVAGGTAPAIPEALRNHSPAGIRAVPEGELRAYYQRLADLNVSPDAGPYPLGSCTMKYNPYLNDWAAALPGFTELHPQAPSADAQGSLELLFEIQEWFKAITGLAGATTQPVAGAQGELVGLKLFQAYHRSRGDQQRNLILIPWSAHGTNFATAAMAGYRAREGEAQAGGIIILKTGPDGRIDRQDLAEKLRDFGPRIAGIMITNPNTGGIFETDFRAIAEEVHAVGGLVYMDGANMNAIAGWCHLGRLGVDAVHQNLHKTWSIPHGGGGPGDCVVAVSARLLPFLPGFQIEKHGDSYVPVRPAHSIGSFHRHWGNFAHKVRAYAYLLRLGREGIRQMTGTAVLNARYCLEKVRRNFPILPAGGTHSPRMHEFIFTLDAEDFASLERVGLTKPQSVVSVGKLFLDFGYHAPTVAWPEPLGLMVEPTESYTQAELDRLCAAIGAMKVIIRAHPEVVKLAPLFTPIGRVDEAAANRQLRLREPLDTLPALHAAKVPAAELLAQPVEELIVRLVNEAQSRLETAGVSA